MSKENIAESVIERLVGWGVRYVFGIIGDNINPLVEALRQRKEDITFITVRHEEAAAFMACAYSKFTGKVGVCLATSGPGVLHLLNGLYDAYKDHVPVLAITGSPSSSVLGTDYTQEISTTTLMSEVAVYNTTLTSDSNVEALVDLALQTSIFKLGVSHLNLPKDIQQMKADPETNGPSAKSILYPKLSDAAGTPDIASLRSAAEILDGGQKIAILAGQGALDARQELEKLADRLGAPVIKALLGKGVLADDSPFTTGGIGPLGTLPSMRAMKECDVLLILGSNMPYLEYYPNEAKGIQVDCDPARIGLRFSVDVRLVGDVKETILALLNLIKRKEDRSFLQKYQQEMDQWRRTLRKVETATGEKVKPQYLVAEAGKILAEDAIVAVDTGAHTVFVARHLQITKDQRFAVSGNLASMGAGLPYAIAAQLAFPNRQCVAFVGDGGFSMLMAELATVKRYRLPVKIILFKNNELSQDVYEQQTMGYDNYGGDLTPIDFVKIAEACGISGYLCRRPDELPHLLKEVLTTPDAALLEVWIDPDQAPAAPDKVLENEFE